MEVAGTSQITLLIVMKGLQRSTKQEFFGFKDVLPYAFSSPWLAWLLALNIFLSGFLSPTDELGRGLNSHHQDLFLSILVFTLLNISRKKSFSPLKSILITGITNILIFYTTALIIFNGTLPLPLREQAWFALPGSLGQITLFALLTGSFLYARTLSKETSASIQRNEAASRNLRNSLENESSSLKTIVESEIEPALNRIQQNIVAGFSKQEILKAVNALIDNTVRPMSQLFNSRATSIDYLKNYPRFVGGKIQRRSMKEILTQSTPLGYISNPIYGTAALTYFVVPFLIYYCGFKVLFPFAIIWLMAVWVLAIFLNQISKERTKKFIYIAFISLFVGLLNSSLFLTLADAIKPKGLAEVAMPTAFIIVVISFGMTVFQVSLYSVQQNYSSISKLNAELEMAIASAKREHWHINKKTSRDLHGGLQARLHALALKIAMDESRGVDGEITIQEFMKVTSMKNRSVENETFENFLQSTRDLWSGVVEVKTKASSTVHQTLASDSALCDAVVEVCREAVNNAIKHGKASLVEIDVSDTGPHEISLVVHNNVSTQISKKNESTGLGSTVYDELTSTWKLKASKKSATFTATFIHN